jgi:hypothetical protein
MVSKARQEWWMAPIVVLLIGTFSAAHAAIDLSTKGSARAFARRSDAPLAEGSQVCREIAQYYPTLGAAFRWHEKRANVENSFQCRRFGRRWTCKASFIFNDKKESERDWALSLEFSVEENGKVSALRCDAAG